MVKWSILFESFPSEEIKLKKKQLSIKLEPRSSNFILYLIDFNFNHHFTIIFTTINPNRG